LIVALLARGAYRSDTAPDPLDSVLGADTRFLAAGFSGWTLAEKATPGLRAAIRQRQRDEVELFRLASRPEPRPEESPAPSLLVQELLAPGPARRPAGHGRRRRRGPPKVYQLKVTLQRTRPPIWRRLLVRSDTTLARMHEIIQTSMGWYDSHLHEFVADGVEYGVPDQDWGDAVTDERGVMLAEVAARPGDRLLYRYDFGDDWEHELVVEKVLEPQPGTTYPMCLKGRRACPPEDVGGVWGYAEFLRVLADPDDPEREERLEWVGGDFDPEEFDAASVNAQLRELA
jgi:hypothetical protein